MEINRLAKFLFILMLLLALVLIAMQGFVGSWIITYFRYVTLLSYIIPLSLRVNLDIGKTYYSISIARDQKIEGTIPRNSTIPEELGRIQFLLTDKTGTLTKNEMVLKKIELEYTHFDTEHMEDLKQMIKQNCL